MPFPAPAGEDEEPKVKETSSLPASHLNWARLHFDTLWRLAFLSVFFIAPISIDKSQAKVEEIIRPGTRLIVLLLVLLLFSLSYRAGREAFQEKKPIWCWLTSPLFFLIAMFPALSLLALLGNAGEVWLLRGLTLGMAVSTLRHTLLYLKDRNPSRAYFALGDFAYLLAVFLAALHRYYAVWGELAALTLPYPKTLTTWFPLASFALLSLTILLSDRGTSLSPAP